MSVQAEAKRVPNQRVLKRVRHRLVAKVHHRVVRHQVGVHLAVAVAAEVVTVAEVVVLQEDQDNAISDCGLRIAECNRLKINSFQNQNPQSEIHNPKSKISAGVDLTIAARFFIAFLQTHRYIRDIDFDISRYNVSSKIEI
jgi:hypothetical protein